jgi:mRNA-degrading endonuclease RelE of RelBE toxin-antitoxin system
MITIVELPSFLKAVKKLFSEDDKKKLYTSLANNPEQGDIIQGTSGVRKMRFALGNKGKSGGSRVIYYYHISESEILMLTAYAKNVQEDLTQEQKNAMRDFIKQLKEK